jgi:xanthine/CO dehydrogenase XdhC/CoxF family maturation factor
MRPPRLDTSLELLVERLDRLSAPGVLATIVATAGSTYRKAGARMLIESDGRLTGLLSGGCFEQDLAEHARTTLAGGTGRIVEYDLRTADDVVYGIGAGCEGAMRVLLEPLIPGGALHTGLARSVTALASGADGALAMVHGGADAPFGTRVFPSERLDEPLAQACRTAIETGRSDHFNEADREVWIEYLAPPPRILICGAGPDVVPLLRVLRLVGFCVTIADHRPAYADPERLAGATLSVGPAATLGDRLALDRFHAAVVMSHHLVSDEAYLAALAGSTVAHIGLLGPRARRERLLAALGARQTGLRGRLRGPLGIDIGALTPEAIALSTAAELHALVAGRTAGLARTADRS